MSQTLIENEEPEIDDGQIANEENENNDNATEDSKNNEQETKEKLHSVNKILKQRKTGDKKVFVGMV